MLCFQQGTDLCHSLHLQVREGPWSAKASLLEEGLSFQKKDVQVMWKEFPSRGIYFSLFSMEKIKATILDEMAIFQGDKLRWKE